MRVIIRGTIYETVREAAAAFGVTTSYIYQALSRGRPDSIGIGMGRSPHPHPNGNRVTIHGITFPSYKAASLELGFDKHYVRVALRRGKPKGLEKIRKAVEKYERKRK